MQVVTERKISAETIRRYVLPLGLILLTLLSLNWLLPAQLAPKQVEMESAEIVDADVTVPTDGISLATVGSNFTNWLPLKGAWQARDGGIEHANRVDFDNYIAYTTRFDAPYTLATTIQHLDGVGAGVLIGMQSLESNANTTLIRFESDGSALFWGDFDGAGQFTGRGFAPISVDPFAANQLFIRNYGDRYDVLLNGETLITDLALPSGSGYIGLAAPETAAFFGDLSLQPLDGVVVDTAVVELVDGVNVGNPVVVDEGVIVEEAPTLLDQVETISGEWVYEDGAIRQVLQEPTDYVTGLNVFGRNYTLASAVTLSADFDDVGGGYIFHAPIRDQLAGSTMVRLLDGGQQIVWGQFDETGVFQGAGNIAVNLPTGEPHQIIIAVANSRYDIQINGETVVSDLPLPVAEGWIGLAAFRGTVTFADVTLDLDG